MSVSRQIRRAKIRNDANAYDQMRSKQKYLELCKNGITPEMFDKQYDDGWKDGWENGVRASFLNMSAALLIVLKEEGLSRDDSIQILRDICQCISQKVTSKEYAEECFRKTGIVIDYDDPITPIKVDKNWKEENA